MFTQFTQQIAEWCTSDPLRDELPGSSYQKGVPVMRFGYCFTPASTKDIIFFRST